MSLSLNGSGGIFGLDQGLNVVGVGTFQTLNVTGNLTVDGVLTYDDVTNVDSIGVVTARSGIHVTGVGASVGIGTDDPSVKLHVHEGDVVIGQTSGANTGITNYIKFGRVGAPKAAIGFINNKPNGRGDIIFMNDLNNNASAFNDSDERLRITADGKIGIGNTLPLHAMHFKNEMASTPSYIHMEVTGTNTVGGGGGIAFDTSASNTEPNNSLYLATIRGERTSDDDGSNNLVFSTSRAGVAGDDGNNHSPAERLRIGTRGQLGLTGANYGTAGQVIKSGGDNAAPTWQNLHAYYFYGEQDTQQGSWPNATWKKIQNLGTRAINNGSSSVATWSESNGVLTIGADGAGYWFLSMGGGIDDIQDADYVQVVIGKNGGTTSIGTRLSSYNRAYSSTSNQITDAQTSCIANLSVGDVVRFYLYHQEGTSDEHSEPSRCFAMGYKI